MDDEDQTEKLLPLRTAPKWRKVKKMFRMRSTKGIKYDKDTDEGKKTTDILKLAPILYFDDCDYAKVTGLIDRENLLPKQQDIYQENYKIFGCKRAKIMRKDIDDVDLSHVILSCPKSLNEKTDGFDLALSKTIDIRRTPSGTKSESLNIDIEKNVIFPCRVTMKNKSGNDITLRVMKVRALFSPNTDDDIIKKRTEFIAKSDSNINYLKEPIRCPDDVQKYAESLGMGCVAEEIFSTSPDFVKNIENMNVNEKIERNIEEISKLALLSVQPFISSDKKKLGTEKIDDVKEKIDESSLFVDHKMLEQTWLVPHVAQKDAKTLSEKYTVLDKNFGSILAYRFTRGRGRRRTSGIITESDINPDGKCPEILDVEADVQGKQCIKRAVFPPVVGVFGNEKIYDVLSQDTPIESKMKAAVKRAEELGFTPFIKDRDADNIKDKYEFPLNSEGQYIGAVMVYKYYDKIKESNLINSAMKSIKRKATDKGIVPASKIMKEMIDIYEDDDPLMPSFVKDMVKESVKSKKDSGKN